MHKTTLWNAQQGHEALASLWAWAKPRLLSGHRLTLSIGEEKRSSEQNARMWAMLADVARQVQWPVNGVMTTLEPEDWKSLVTAAVKSETRMAAGLSGGFVMLGRKTSTMSVQEMTDVIEYLFAFGAERGVEWKNEEPEK